MYVIVAGTGQLGTGLAKVLSNRGDDVVVIGDGAELADVGSGFDGLVVDGNPADRDALESAGIRQADLFVAATADDNLNIMAIQVAKVLFGVEKVLARISDPERESFYKGIGLETVCPTSTGINQILSMLQSDNFEPLRGRIDPNVVAVVPPDEWIGKRMGDIRPSSGRRLVGLLSRGRVFGFERARTVGARDSVLLARQ